MRTKGRNDAKYTSLTFLRAYTRQRLLTSQIFRLRCPFVGLVVDSTVFSIGVITGDVMVEDESQRAISFESASDNGVVFREQRACTIMR